MEKVNCTTCGTDNPVNYKYCSNCGFELPKISTENLENTEKQPAKEKTGTGKKILTFIVAVLAFGLTYVAVQQVFFKMPSIDKAMMAMAGEINKTCPLMVDAETRLDNAVALPQNVFQYNYTLVNAEKATADIEGMKEYLEPVIVNVVKTNPQMKFQRDLRMTINYYYKDKEGNYLFLVSVTPDKYE